MKSFIILFLVFSISCLPDRIKFYQETEKITNETGETIKYKVLDVENDPLNIGFEGIVNNNETKIIYCSGTEANTGFSEFYDLKIELYSSKDVLLYKIKAQEDLSNDNFPYFIEIDEENDENYNDLGIHMRYITYTLKSELLDN